MAVWLKRGRDAQQRAENQRQIRATVEGILADIEVRGEVALSPRDVQGEALITGTSLLVDGGWTAE